MAGALQLRNSRMVALDFFDNVNSDYYGVDEEGLAANEDDAVVVPENGFNLTDEQFQQLQQSVNPLADSDNHGIELYEETIEFIVNL